MPSRKPCAPRRSWAAPSRWCPSAPSGRRAPSRTCWPWAPTRPFTCGTRPSTAWMPAAWTAVLVAALRKLSHQMLWTGWKGVDDDQGLVPIYLAQALGLPHATLVVGAEINGEPGHRTARDRGRQGGAGRAAASGAHGPEGPQRAALRQLEGHHGRQAQADSHLGRCRPWASTRPASPAPAVEMVSLERPPDRPPGRELSTARPRRPRPSWFACCTRKRR